MFQPDDEDPIVHAQIKAALAHSQAQLDRGEGFTVAEAKARSMQKLLRIAAEQGAARADAIVPSPPR